MNSHEGSTESVRRKRWLCVAYAFPPINRSGTHRTLGFVKHLDRMGWKATVLTVRPRDELLDESLSDEVPASTTVLRTAWVDCVGVVKRSLLPRTGAGASPGAVGSGRCDTTFAVSKAGRPGFRDWCGRLLQTPDSRIGWIGPAVRAAMRERLEREPNLQIDYATIADAESLEEVTDPVAEMVALVAARVGKTRLIDNLPIKRPEAGVD